MDKHKTTTLTIEAGDGSGAEQDLRLYRSPLGIDAAAWNALLQASPQPTPFMRHEWLAAMHTSACAGPDSGWTPVFLTLNDSSGLRAACALYAKSHSFGEYVFDWSWARALEEAGLRYYPKLLCASPFTPVPGSRLLARTQADRLALLHGMQALARQQAWSSAHVLFLDAADLAAAQAAGWQTRSSVQFHWRNRHLSSAGDPAASPYADFADFLASMQRDKRKKIQQERSKVSAAGLVVESRCGPQITAADWDVFYRCYLRTYQAHQSQPYLSREFFALIAASMPHNWLMFIAKRDGHAVAASLVGLDPERQTAYGRYWGALEVVPCLHFELCYYQPLQWCIAQRWACFEGGAQGEHKIARGLLPVPTWSAHWLAHPGLGQAVARFLQAETAEMGRYVNELQEHTPFKNQTPVETAGNGVKSGL